MATSLREVPTAFIAETDELPTRDTASLRKVRRSWSRKCRAAPAQTVLDLGLAIGRKRPSLRWIGYELVRHHRGAFAALDDAQLARFAPALDSWESVDAFGRILVGPAWAAGRISGALIESWRDSPNRWLRRAALVSTVALNMPADSGRPDGDARRTLAICEPLIDDRDDMVVKALSWALRALAVRDPDAVRAFLDRHDAALAARVKREVGNKMRTGLKNP
jgi:3-methyladenine DNA glycosylase AlkD